MGSSSTATGNYYNPSMAAKQKMMFNNESYDMEFMMKLYVAFGWAKESDLAVLKDELTKKAINES